jgi:hypothetical protein
MSASGDEKDADGKVVRLADAFKQPVKRLRGRKKPQGQKTGGGDGGGGGFIKPQPDILPPDAPVKALGKLGLTYYFLNRSGEFIEMAAKDLGRLNIIALFGGDKYLIETWPTVGDDGVPKKHKFNHDRLGPVLIESCEALGLFDPTERVRGPGTWADDDGTLIFHCGDVLWVGGQRAGTGLRGRYLYPGAPALPEPLLKGAKPMDQASVTLDTLCTWNFARGETDAMLMLGWVGAAMLGEAPRWRPACWVTGGRGTGKSTLLKLVKWILGPHGLITSADATGAAIAQRVANSSRPVAIDELEASDDNRRARDIIALARIASSGDSKDRGSPGGKAVSFTVRNCFLFSAIIIPPLRPADRSRLAILELGPIEKRRAEQADVSGDEEADDDPLLGEREKWETIGRQLRGRLVQGWDRYHQTFRAYRRALVKGGHDSRGADQFGALGAAFDLLMFEALDQGNADVWARGLPPGRMAETSGNESDESECLAHLLASTLQTFKGGSQETVSHWLRTARTDLTLNKIEDSSDALRALARVGIKVYRVEGTGRGNDALWEIAIANTHDGLAAQFRGTQWASTAGSSSAWPQMFRRLPGAQFHNHHTGEQIRLRIDGQRKYVTVLPWHTVFPPVDKTGVDRDEFERVERMDRAPEITLGEGA